MPHDNDEDDSITLKPSLDNTNKVAAEEADILLFDKTSYEDDKLKDPLEISPDKHSE